MKKAREQRKYYTSRVEARGLAPVYRSPLLAQLNNMSHLELAFFSLVPQEKVIFGRAVHCR